MEIRSAAANLLLQIAPSTQPSLRPADQSLILLHVSSPPRQSCARSRRPSPGRRRQREDPLEPSHSHQPPQAQVPAAQEAAEGLGRRNRDRPVEEAEVQRFPVEGEGPTRCAEEGSGSRPVGSRLPEAAVAGDSRRGH